MSEAIWNAGKDAAAMLQTLGVVPERKTRLVSAALIRRIARLNESAPVRAILDQFDADDPQMPKLIELVDHEMRAVGPRLERVLRDRETDDQDRAAASEGQGVTYPAEVPHSASAMLDEEAGIALASAENMAYGALRNVLDSISINTLAQQVQESIVSEGRATVLSAVAESWRQYADQIAEESANHPRKRKVLISNAVQYIGRGRQYLEGKVDRKLREIYQSEADALVNLLRDIFGNPFRPVTLDPRWLSSTVLDLARTIYDERVFERMPILGDALMDAGCDNETLIQHCQGPGPHVRGCWVVDLLLGKA